jgi:NADH:ubiquinone oxidoreductase subunit D
MESMINCFKLSTEGYNLPVRTVYAIHEAPKGELGLCIISG